MWQTIIDAFAAIVARIVSDWRARQAYRDQGAVAAAEQARAIEASRMRAAQEAEREIFASGDPDLSGRLRELYGPDRRT